MASSEQGLMPWKRRKEYKRGRVSLLKKEGIRKKYWEIAWKSRMRPNVAENWMNRGKRCRRSCERSTDCPCFQGNAGEPQGITAAPVARCGEKEE